MNPNPNPIIRTLKDIIEANANNLNVNNNHDWAGVGNRLNELPVVNNESELIKGSLEELEAACKKLFEVEGASSHAEAFPNYDPSQRVLGDDLRDNLPELDITENLGLESERSDIDGIFNIIQSISNRISTGEISLENHSSMSIMQLIRDNSDNHPLVTSAVDILSNHPGISNSIILNQLWGEGWRSITLGQLFDTFSNLPLNMPLIEIGVSPFKLITFGFVYSLIVKTFVKHYIPHTNGPSININRRLNIKIKNASMCIVCLILAPVAAFTITNVGHTSLFDAFNIKIGTIGDSNVVSEEKLSFLPLWVRKKTQTKKVTKKIEVPLKFKVLHFLKKSVKWLNIFIILYLQLKYNWFKSLIQLYENNLFLVNNILIYLSILGICVALVFFSLAIFILSNKNDIVIDLSNIKIKFFREYLENLIRLRNLRLPSENLKKEIIFLLKITILVLFSIPFLYLMQTTI